MTTTTVLCRLFNEMGLGGESVIQAREAGLRSSSETSVFDFRESDSDGETGPERQSLTAMRRDRDRRIQEKHQALDPTTDLVKVGLLQTLVLLNHWFFFFMNSKK